MYHDNRDTHDIRHNIITSNDNLIVIDFDIMIIVIFYHAY